MSDRTPPADLIDLLADASDPIESLRNPHECAHVVMRPPADVARSVLEALAEWAGGGLIDTGTWQRINAEQVDPDDVRDDLSSCPYYARWGSLPGHDPEASCYADCHSEPSCVTDEPTGGWPLRRPLFALTSKEAL